MPTRSHVVRCLTSLVVLAGLVGPGVLAGCTSTSGHRADRLFREGRYAEAARAYRRAARRHPERTRWRRGYRLSRQRAAALEVEEAEEAADRGNLPLAIRYMERAIRWFPPGGTHRRRRGELAERLAEARATRRLLEEAIAEGRASRARALLEELKPLAASFDDLDRLADRVGDLTPAEPLEPGALEALLADAEAALERGDAVAAVEALERASEAHPDRPGIARRLEEARARALRTLTDRAREARDDGRLREALVAASRAASLAPGDGSVRDLHGQLVDRVAEALADRAREASRRDLVGLAALRWRQAVALAGDPAYREEASEADARLVRAVAPTVHVELYRNRVQTAPNAPFRERILSALSDRGFGDRTGGGYHLAVADVSLNDPGPSDPDEADPSDAGNDGADPPPGTADPEDRRSRFDALRRETRERRFQADRTEVALREAREALQEARDEVAYWEARLDEAGDDGERFLARDRLERARELRDHRRRIVDARENAYRQASEAYEAALADLDNLEAAPAGEGSAPRAVVRGSARIQLMPAPEENGSDDRPPLVDEVVEVVIDPSGLADGETDPRQAARETLADRIASRVAEAVDEEEARRWQRTSGVGPDADARTIDRAMRHLRWLELRGREPDPLVVSGLTEATGYDPRTDRNDLLRLDLE